MAAEEAVPLWELEEVDGEVVTLRDCLLDLREAIDCHRVSLGVLRTPGGDGEQSFALVPITTLEERCLVAVPHAAWNKAIARRRLPRDALSRGVNLEVPAQGEPPTQAHAAFKVKVWVGFLNHELEDSWTAGKTLSTLSEFREALVRLPLLCLRAFCKQLKSSLVTRPASLETEAWARRRPRRWRTGSARWNAPLEQSRKAWSACWTGRTSPPRDRLHPLGRPWPPKASPCCLGWTMEP